MECRAAADVADVADVPSAEEVPSDQKIRIKLKSYWVDRLTQSVEKIREAARSTNAQFSGPVYLPTRYVSKSSPSVKSFLLPSCP